MVRNNLRWRACAELPLCGTIGQVEVTTPSKASHCHKFDINNGRMLPRLIVWLIASVSSARYLKSLLRKMDDNTVIEYVATDSGHHNSTNIAHDNRSITLALSDLINPPNTTHILENNRLEYVLSSNFCGIIMQKDPSPRRCALKKNTSLFCNAQTSPTGR